MQTRSSAIYVRTATADAENSIENQSKVLREYAAIHNLDIVRVYTDRGKSGAHIGGREGIVRLLEDIKNPNRDCDVGLTCDLSRLARSASDFASIASACELAGVEICCCHGKLPGDAALPCNMLAGMRQPEVQTCTNPA